MHALTDIHRLTKENEYLQKITKDYAEVKKLIDENEKNKKLLEEQKDEIAKLRKAMAQQTFDGQFQTQWKNNEFYKFKD